MILFNKITPAKAAGIVAKIEARLTEARTALLVARENYGTANLAVEEGTPNATAAKEKALKELRKIESEIAEAEATISAARIRHADAIQTEANEQAEMQWSQVKEIASERSNLGQQIEEDAKRITVNMEKLLRLNVQQYETAPKKDVGIHNCALSPDDTVMSFRKFIFKQGKSFSWACKWPWGTNEIPDFTKWVEEGNSWSIAQKERHAKPAVESKGGRKLASTEDIFS